MLDDDPLILKENTVTAGDIDPISDIPLTVVNELLYNGLVR